MQSGSFRKILIRLAVTFVLSGIGQWTVHAESLTAGEVIQKAVARGQQTEARLEGSSFAYTKSTVTEDLDSSGHVKDRKEKTYEIAWRGGHSQVNLISVNGHAPTSEDRSKKTENEISVNQLLGLAKGKGDNFLTPELAARFTYNFVSESEINGRRAYQISFQPKQPALPAENLADKLLNQISGVLWIDAEEFEIAQAQVSLRSEVNVFGGIAGTLKRLAYTLVRTRLAEGIWFNTLSSGDFQGRKLLDSMHVKVRSQSVNFRPMANN